MNTALLQIRIDEDLKKEASNLFEQLGLDISSAVRMFLKRAVLESGIPFNINIPKTRYKAERGYKALLELGKISELNGNSNMTLDEINAEIKQARKEAEQKF